MKKLDPSSRISLAAPSPVADGPSPPAATVRMRTVSNGQTAKVQTVTASAEARPSSGVAKSSELAGPTACCSTRTNDSVQPKASAPATV